MRTLNNIATLIIAPILIIFFLLISNIVDSKQNLESKSSVDVPQVMSLEEISEDTNNQVKSKTHNMNEDNTFPKLIEQLLIASNSLASKK